MDEEVMQGLIHIIETFEEEMDMKRDEFVIVVHPECAMFETEKHRKVAGVEIITNRRMYESAVGCIPRDELKYLEQIITDLKLDQPLVGTIELTLENGTEVEIEFLDDDEDEPEPIEMVICDHCEHPVSVLNSIDFISAVCPWCGYVKEIDE